MANRRPLNRSLYVSRIVLAAVAAACLVKAFALDLVIIRGDSMSPTIGAGTVALVARSAYGIRLPFSGSYAVRWAEPVPGDIVLVAPAANVSRRAVKRIFETGPAYLKAEAGMLSGRGGTVQLGRSSSARLAGSSYIAAGRVFIVGDNGALSFDSRDYGSVPIETIVGKVLLYAGGPCCPVSKTEQ